jgi:signal transduction histidine kinase/ActR/RegA family two-component response regulator
MSRKQLQTLRLARLDALFEDLGHETSVLSLTSNQTVTGWTWECDADGLYTECSPEVEAILGVSAKEFIGQPILLFHLSPDSSAELKSALDTGAYPIEVTVNYVTRNRESIPVILSVLSPFHNAGNNGKNRGWRGFARVVIGEISLPDIDIREEDLILPPPSPPKPVRSRSRPKPTTQKARKKETPTAIPAARIAKAEVSSLLELLDQGHDRSWSEDERMLVEQVADQLTLALENARLFQENINLLEETRQRNEELTTLNRIISTASRSLELQEMLQEILIQLISILEMQAGLVTVLDDDQQNLRLVFQHSLPDALYNHLVSHGFDGTLCHLVFRRGEVMYISDLQDGSPVDASSLIAMGLNSYIGIPLESRGNILGTVCLFGSDQAKSSSADTALLKTLGQQIGVAVENAGLFQKTQESLAEMRRQTANLNVLNEMGRALTSTPNIETVLENIHKYTAELVDATNFFVALYDSDNNSLSFPLVVESGEQSDIASRPLRNSLADYVIRNQHPLLISENIESRMKELGVETVIIGMPTQSWLGIPMTIGDQVIGMMAVQSPLQNQYIERDRDLLIAVARQAAIAFQNVRLLDETRRRADQLQTAAVIARDSTGTLALDVLLDRAANLIRVGFNYYHVAIFLLDEDREKARVKAATGEAGAEMKQAGYSLNVGSRSVIGYVAQYGQPLVINDISQDPIHRPSPLLPDTRAETGIPLKIGQKVIGVLNVQTDKVNAFEPDDVSVLQTLADQLAIAVENARSYELSLNAVDEMRKADQLKSQFLANMSHELRTPLNSIIGFSRVIIKGIDGPITELQQQDLTAIYNSGQHLLNLINDILDLSKIEAGKMELNFEENVNLADLINSVMSTAAGLVKDRPIKLYHELAPDLPGVRADPLKIRQVLLNLLSNAAKFTEQGSITIKASLQHDVERQTEVLISVTDTGAGISPDDLKKLFQPFSQVDASATRKTGGSGLGLSISRHLVEMHGGRIGVESEVGKGSSFYFVLPTPVISKPSLDNSEPAPTSQPLVLSIDNERPILQLYERYLKSHGYQVYGLTDPTKAVDLARKLHPVAITLDVMMPGCDGWQVLEDLKADPNTRSIPVIICSILEDQGKASSLGASNYLTKPILEDDLIQALTRLNGSVRTKINSES